MKRKKIISVVLTALIGCSFFGGCGVKEQDDYANKEVIQFSVYNGGYGTKYAENLAKQFNDSRTDNYAIKIIPEKRNGSDIASEINTGYSNNMGYILSGLDIMSAVYQDTLEDLSDIVRLKVDGSDKTIEDKILRKDTWYDVFKVNNKLYALPYSDALAGLQYDHDLFVEKGWYFFAGNSDTTALNQQGITYHADGSRLIFDSAIGKTNYKEGDYILSAGKDGKFGTYDDGQPTNIIEWDTMLNKISITASPFIWSDYDDYTHLLYATVVAQYLGSTGFEQIFTFDTKGQPLEMQDGSQEVITVENGYKVYGAKAIYQALEFLNTYLNTESSPNYTHSICDDNSKNYQDAQNLFLLGYLGDQHNKQSAMLIDGSWWENEARAMFNSIGELDGSRGFGKREYRMMLLPNFEGQKSDKSVVLTGDTGCIFLKKDKDTNKIRVAKEFIAFLLKDDSLREFSRMTGSLLAYDYDLTKNDLDALTPYSRNIFEIYSDSDNVEIIRPLLIENESPLCFATDKKGFYYSMIPKISGAFIYSTTRALRNHGLNVVWDGIKHAYSATEWNEFILDARGQGFYA